VSGSLRDIALVTLTQCETGWRALLADHPDAKKELDLVLASVVQI
jgi:hypothetical protein